MKNYKYGYLMQRQCFLSKKRIFESVQLDTVVGDALITDAHAWVGRRAAPAQEPRLRARGSGKDTLPLIV